MKRAFVAMLFLAAAAGCSSVSSGQRDPDLLDPVTHKVPEGWVLDDH